MAYILGHSDGTLDFDELIESIRLRYPDTVVTDLDFYATSIARATEISQAKGMRIPNAPLDCWIRVSKEHGVQRVILIPIRDGISLYGRLDRLGCMFNTQKDSTAEPSMADVQPLIDILYHAGLNVEHEVLAGQLNS